MINLIKKIFTINFLLQASLFSSLYSQELPPLFSTDEVVEKNKLFDYFQKKGFCLYQNILYKLSPRITEKTLLRFSHKSTILFYSEGHTIKMWSPEIGIHHGFFIEPTGKKPSCITISPDDTMLAVGYKSYIHLWNIQQRHLVYTLPTHDKEEIINIAIAQDNNTIAFSTNKKNLYVWKKEIINQESVYRHQSTIPESPTILALCDDNSTLISAYYNKTRFINIESGRLEREVIIDSNQKNGNMWISCNNKILFYEHDPYINARTLEGEWHHNIAKSILPDKIGKWNFQPLNTNSAMLLLSNYQVLLCDHIGTIQDRGKEIENYMKKIISWNHTSDKSKLFASNDGSLLIIYASPEHIIYFYNKLSCLSLDQLKICYLLHTKQLKQSELLPNEETVFNSIEKDIIRACLHS